MKARDLPRYYNVVDILERNLRERGAKIALYSAERQMTFQEVSAEVNQVGNALKQLGVGFGDVVGIMAPDSAAWVTSFFGTVKIGAVALGIDTASQPPQCEYVLRDSRARVLIVDAGLLLVVDAVRDRCPCLRQVIVIGGSGRADALDFDDWMRDGATNLEAEQTHRDDYCSLSYSSGSTGEPKGVLHAHRTYTLVGELIGVGLYGQRESDRIFSIPKLSFAFGLTSNLIYPWYVGASCVLYSGQPQAVTDVLATIDRFKPTVLYGVPTSYVGLLAVRGLNSRYDLSSLRLCVSGGEVLPVSVWHAWKAKTGLELMDVNGSTENCSIFLASRPGEVRPGSTGRPAPGYRAKLVDEAGAEVGTGEIGNLLISGESAALFYLHHPEKSRQTFRGEWLFTGDQYYVDNDGYYWYAGRADDMLKVGGLWVAPAEIEGVITAHPAVQECAVVGYPDGSKLIKPKAIVCLNEGFTASPELAADLRTWCMERLAVHKCPRWIDFVAALPKTSTGKIQRFRLRDNANK